jgi:hypothetical protein
MRSAGQARGQDERRDSGIGYVRLNDRYGVSGSWPPGNHGNPFTRS